jgi:hypothetical protein
MSTALAVAAALVALMFCFAITERWLVRRRPHELAWAIAMGLFVAGALSVAWGVGVGWGSVSFRLYYLFGAVLNVAWLAFGQVLISGSNPKWAGAARTWLIAGSAFATGILAATPLRGSIDRDQLPKGDEVFGAGPRILAGIGSGGGALIVFGGTAMATIALARARRRGQRGAGPRAIGTGLIAVGTLVLGRSGGYAERGQLNGFSITLLVGITILFAGYLVASRRSQPKPAQSAQSA